LKPVRFTRRAETEIERAAAWYEKRSEGLGEKFLGRVKEAVQSIAINPLGYAAGVGGARRCLVPRFQDALYFMVEPDESIVIGCLHSKRNPILAKERALGVRPIDPS
jgi:plasmid stabilization system protein ParE